LGISRRGIEFEAIDGRPVHLIFVIANHPDRQPDYLRILSSIVSLVRSETFRREILDCMSTSQVEDKLCAALSRLMQRTSVYGT
jgi:mannitol/fructose-specific phosphotransferase system IIA component (Ntr-type)